MYIRPSKTKLMIIALLFFLLPGCQSTSTLYLGKHVKPELVVPLPGDMVKDQWETSDLTIDYIYSENNRIFQINGQVKLADMYIDIYHILDRFNIYLLFLDSDLTVIDTQTLASNIPGASPKESIPFDKSFQTPQNATAFSFAYYGTAREVDRTGGNNATIWLVPK